MIKPIYIQRALVANGILEPVQCSQNSQIAINNSDHITILDPKLPLLHRSVYRATVNGEPQTVVNADGLFENKAILRFEGLESAHFLIFLRLLIQDDESQFSFGRVAEPLIVSLRWSPLQKHTKDCHLGVLLSSGEVLVLSRKTLDLSKYEVEHRSFTALLDQLQLPQECLTLEGDVIITNDQYLHLRVTCFEFAEVSGQTLLVLSHESGEVSIHHLSSGLHTIDRLSAGGVVVKMCCAGNLLYFLLNDNSVKTATLDQSGTFSGFPEEVLPPSRFLVSQLVHVSEGLTLVVDSRQATILAKGQIISVVRLSCRTTVVSTCVSQDDGVFSLLLSHECGNLSALTYADLKLHLTEAPKPLVNELTRMKNKYHSTLVHEQNKAPSVPFQPLLLNDINISTALHGVAYLPFLGIYVAVASFSPRDVIHHEIKSRKDFSVFFLNLWKTALISAGVSNSYLCSVFIKGSQTIPFLLKAAVDGNEEALVAYTLALTNWSRLALPTNNQPLSVRIMAEGLQENLIRNFRDNEVIGILQRLHFATISMLRTMDALNKKPLKALVNMLGDLLLEQSILKSKIRAQFLLTIIQFAEESKIHFVSDIDKYILVTAYHALQLLGWSGRATQVPKSATCTLTSELCSETFSINKSDTPDFDFLTIAQSTTGHKWRRCDATLVPIISSTSKTDELQLFSYIANPENDSIIMASIKKVIDFCIFTGNRTFAAGSAV